MTKTHAIMILAVLGLVTCFHCAWNLQNYANDFQAYQTQRRMNLEEMHAAK